MDARTAEQVTHAFGRRRADEPGRDQACYRLGSAFDVAGCRDLNEYLVLGLLKAGPIALQWLVEAALDEGGSVDLPTAMRALLRDEARAGYLVDLGVWARWQWEKTVYCEAVDRFEAGEKADRAWRDRPITSAQAYIIEEIVSANRTANPDFKPPSMPTRGEAHDWIRQQGGNPRFANDRSPPEPPQVA